MKYEEVLESIKVGRTFYATALNNIKALYSTQVQAGFNEAGSAVFVIPAATMWSNVLVSGAALCILEAVSILDNTVDSMSADVKEKPNPASLKIVYTPEEYIAMLEDMTEMIFQKRALIVESDFVVFNTNKKAQGFIEMACLRLRHFIAEAKEMFANNTLPQAIVKPEAKENPFPAKVKPTRNSKKKNDGESDNKPESEPTDTNTEADIDSAPSANGEHA